MSSSLKASAVMKRKITVCLIILMLIQAFNLSNADMYSNNMKEVLTNEPIAINVNNDLPNFDINEIIMTLPSLPLNYLNLENSDLSSNWIQSSVPGAPQLPSKHYRILLPPNIKLTSVKIDILEEKIVQTKGEYSFAPALVPVALLANGVYVSQENLMNHVYSEDQYWPNNIIQSIKIQELRSAKILEFYYYPIQYNPVLNSIYEHQDVRISISWDIAEKEVFDSLTSRFLKDFSDSFDNYQEISYLYNDVNSGPPDTSYVIVTTNDIESNSTKLDDFVRFKHALGFNVQVITEDEFGTAEGKDRALNIRTWLQNNYISDSIEYVLLIGDPNPDDETDPADSYGDIPMLMCWPRSAETTYKSSPTDYFYADLTGNWDTDGDNLYGEHSEDSGVDFYPEVFVGRIPVYSEEYSTLDNVLQNIIDHHTNAGDEKQNILEPMAISNYYHEDYGDDERTDGLDCPEDVFINIVSPLGMQDTIMYETAGLDPVPITAFGYDMPLTSANFISEFNNGYGAVFWWGHGSETSVYRKYWLSDDGDGVPESSEMNWITFLQSSDMPLLETDQPAFFYQSSCHNGYPENPDNLGYSLLKNGVAVSTVAASRVSWYLIGTWNHSQYWQWIADNTGIGYYYMENLLKNNFTSGEALFMAKALGGDGTYSESWMNKMDFNLYGDPQMDYWGSNQPNMPTNPSPADLESVDSPFIVLSVDVTDPDGDQLNVAFYNATDDSLIGIVTDIVSGEEVLYPWTVLPEGSSHEWYVIVGDEQETRKSPTWSFTITESEPTWDQTPTDQEIQDGEQFRYDLNASDPSGIDYWWINDTTNFNIDSNGVITNATILPIGNYTVEIKAYDSYSRFCVAVIKIRVIEVPVIFEFTKTTLLLILSSSISLSLILYRKRKKNRALY